MRHTRRRSGRGRSEKGKTHKTCEKVLDGAEDEYGDGERAR
jgi:hypothetical protein